MINEKKEIRVISDLELKDVSGGYALFVWGALWIAGLVGGGVAAHMYGTGKARS